jgi:protein-tyrosine phosphatase
VSIVDATTLNDFHDTSLAQVLEPHRPSDGERVKVGIVGVWTEAKVSFLAYELLTRYPMFDIGVCSALCASSSRAEHYHALEQLSRILGVALFSSVGEFSDWLLHDRLELPLPGVDARAPRLVLQGHERCTSAEELLEAEEQKLVRYLFRDCQRVDLQVLDGGFSGNRVMGATGIDRHGHQQVPHVVKIGPQGSIGRERAHFERIESVLGNAAPQIADFADFTRLGALKYRYASMGGGFSTTFQKQYQSGVEFGQLERVLRMVFERQLGRLYAAARRERCNLLEHYGFDARWAPSVAERVRQLTGGLSEDALVFPLRSRGDGTADTAGPTTTLYDLRRFYSDRLAHFPQDAREAAYFSFIHGDLNGANIIVDRQQNVWLIDFFHTRRAHVLMDLIKLENDVLYIMTPLDDDDAFAKAMLLTDSLLEVSDLAAKLPERCVVGGEAFERAWSVVRLLRSFYPDLIQSDRSALQLLIGQLRYAVHTQSFDECNERQKRWALYTSCRAAELIDEYYTRDDQLRVDWLPLEYTREGRVGLTILPGRRDMRRDLSRDLDVLEALQASHILCLLSDDEMNDYGVPGAVQAYEQRGFAVHQLPIRDQSVSTIEEMRQAVEWMKQAIARGASVVIHCAGGLGRSGIAAAAYLKECGLDAQRAIEVVRQTRSERAIETSAQEQFVADYPML